MKTKIIETVLKELHDKGCLVLCEGKMDYLFHHSFKAIGKEDTWEVYNTSFRTMDVKEINIKPNYAEIIIRGDL